MPSIFERLQGRMPAPMPNPFNLSPFDNTARDARRAVTPFDIANMGGYGSPVGSPGIETELGGPDVSPLIQAMMQPPGMGQMGIPGLPPQVAMGARAGADMMPSVAGGSLERAPELAQMPEAPPIDPRTMFGSAMNLPQPPTAPTDMEQFIAQFLPEEQGGGVDGLGGTTLPRGPAGGDTRPWIPTTGGPQRNMQGAPDEGHMTSVGQWFPGPKPVPDPDAKLRAEYNLRQKGMQFSPELGWHPPEGSPRATGILELLGRAPDALSPEEQMRVTKFQGMEQQQDAQRQNAIATMQQDARAEKLQERGLNPMQATALAGGQMGGAGMMDNPLLMSAFLGPEGAAEFQRNTLQAKALESQIAQAREDGMRAERMGDKQLAAQAYQSANALQMQLAGINAGLTQSNNQLKASLAGINAQTGLGRERISADRDIAGMNFDQRNREIEANNAIERERIQSQLALGQGEQDVNRQDVANRDPMKQVDAARAMMPFDPQSPPDARMAAEVATGQIGPATAQTLSSYFDSNSWNGTFEWGDNDLFAQRAAARFGIPPELVMRWVESYRPGG